MPQSLIQTSAEVIVTAGNTGSVTLNGVTAGNLLALVADNETDGVTFSAPTDNNGNTWAIAVQGGNSTCGVSCIAHAQNVNAGNATVTLAPSSGSKTYRFKVLEISGSVTSGNPDVTSSIIEGANTTNHVSSADASHINPSGPCFVICVGSTSNTPGAKTPGSGYTTIANTLAFGHWQYQIFTSAPANEQGAWSSSNSVRNAGVIAAFKAAAATGGVLKNAGLDGRMANRAGLNGGMGA
jgi:hypothetical protein